MKTTASPVPSSLADIIQGRDNAWTLAQLAKLLSCSRGKLYTLVEQGRIPYFRLGTMIRFYPRTTADWLRSKTVEV